MEKLIKNKGGFAIVEIIISLMLVSFALVAVAAVFPRMTMHRKVIKEVDVANIIAMEELEKIQLFSKEFPVLANDPNTAIVAFLTPPPVGFGPVDTRQIDGTNYDVLFESGNNGNPELFLVRVTVAWNKGGKPHRVSLMGAIR